MERVVDEAHRPEDQISWEVVPRGGRRFQRLLYHTIEETVFQYQSGAKAAIELLVTPEFREGMTEAKVSELLAQANDALVTTNDLTRSIEEILVQDPKLPLPISHRYRAYEMIALDRIERVLVAPKSS